MERIHFYKKCFEFIPVLALAISITITGQLSVPLLAIKYKVNTFS